MTIKPDYLFKLEEESGLLTIEQIIERVAKKDLEEYKDKYRDFEKRLSEVFDTKNGRYAEQYESVGHIKVADAIRKFG